MLKDLFPFLEDLTTAIGFVIHQAFLHDGLLITEEGQRR